ncbi:MAG: SLC13 family permease [Candidatus Omnitrophica bacterium]|nr:SLC13 family permease [Candidatus Omnitrophota bacterium]
MTNRIALKFIFLILLIIIAGFLGNAIGFNPTQIVATSIFFTSIFATLLFWNFRLAVAFLGISLLLITKTVDLENAIKFASLEVILFLVGMMVLVGLLKEVGFFAWLITLFLRVRNLTAKRFILMISVFSALLACCVDEVTSIMFMVAAILEICDYFEVEPIPFIIISVLATNIGSSGTVLGNPIGILIASKSGLTFEDFIVKAFPLMCLCLLFIIFIISIWYRKAIKRLDGKIKELQANEILIRLISVPPEKQLKRGLGIFALTLFFISLHHRLENIWGLETNTLLLSIPLIFAGGVMIWRRNRARRYIEQEVDWWTLLFFLILFAQAGTLKYTGATDVLAKKMIGVTGSNPNILIGAILWISAIGSSILDNVVLVAAFIPIVQSLQALHFNLQPLWWALLFGGCLGGNITLIGSTANIVALGILEKEKNIRITFFKWFWIGLSVGLITTAIVWLVLIALPFYR